MIYDKSLRHLRVTLYVSLRHCERFSLAYRAGIRRFKSNGEQA